MLAGHLDTVPLAGANLPTRLDGADARRPRHGDMKGGVAVQLAVAARSPEPEP